MMDHDFGDPIYFENEIPMSNYPSLKELIEMAVGDCYLGWCTECGDWTHEMTEPDVGNDIDGSAENYQCPSCGTFNVRSPFTLLLLEWYHDDES